MSGLATLARLRKEGLDAQRRSLADLERRHAQLVAERAAIDIDEAREAALARADPSWALTLPAWASALRGRRSRLDAALAAASGEIAAARDRVSEAWRELKRIEQAIHLRAERAATAARRAEQMALDEIALTLHRRK
ncbi:MAG: flagellar FliJ family protein [Alphaproteobacteria bacterium]